jgi:ribosomal protein S18 acetylase RimI-like enzyme
MGNLEVRRATAADLDGVMDVERSWPVEMQAPPEKFVSRLELFPEGFYVALLDGRIVGASTSEIMKYDLANPPKTWDDATDCGWIKKTHTPNGNALYVVSVGVHSQFRSQGIGTALVEAQKQLMGRKNLDFLVLGARCPGYEEYYPTNPVPAEKYIMLKREDGQPIDPEVRFYSIRCGLEALKALPEYMGKGGDPKSRDYGVVMAYRNPFKK